jgi:hypothetical protein
MSTATRLGPYSRFEKPSPLVVTFTESDNVTVKDISGYTAQAQWKARLGPTMDVVHSFPCSLTNTGTDGQVTVPWGTANPSPFDLATVVEMEVWVGNGTVRYASEKFRFAVRDTVATVAPTL